MQKYEPLTPDPESRIPHRESVRFPDAFANDRCGYCNAPCERREIRFLDPTSVELILLKRAAIAGDDPPKIKTALVKALWCESCSKHWALEAPVYR